MHIDSIIGEKLLELLNKYSLSHNLGLPNGLIAATSIVKKVPLYTLNERDFKFIDEIEFFSAKTFFIISIPENLV